MLLNEVGHRTAITTYILKIASRCNLSCSYCYMYTGPDQSWRELPVFMDIATARRAYDDIASYAGSRGLQSVTLVLHGGEVSLVSEALLREYVGEARRIIGECGVGVQFCLQSNAFRISDALIDTWLDLEIDIGVSVDLSPESHDRLRVDKAGRGSFDAVCETLDRIKSRSGNTQPVGLLSVIDPSVSPLAAWDYLESFGVNFIDLLLPDETWESATPDDLAKRFGPWLSEFWDLYMSRPRQFRVRWFYGVIKLLAGGICGSDSIGMSAAGVLIVDTDGSYVFHDALRMAERELNSTGIAAGSGRLAELERKYVMGVMTIKREHLHESCAECPVNHVCGGGHVVHRYSRAQSLNNPSVYCGALKPFYLHAEDSLKLPVDRQA